MRYKNNVRKKDRILVSYLRWFVYALLKVLYWLLVSKPYWQGSLKPLKILAYWLFIKSGFATLIYTDLCVTLNIKNFTKWNKVSCKTLLCIFLIFLINVAFHAHLLALEKGYKMEAYEICSPDLASLKAYPWINAPFKQQILLLKKRKTEKSGHQKSGRLL